MAQTHTNYSMLPFYSDTKYQNHNVLRRINNRYASEVWPLVSERKKIPPFQIISAVTFGGAVAVTLHGMDGTSVDISAQISSLITFQTFSSYEIMVYDGLTALASAGNTTGQYYLEIGNDTSTWYSEVFSIVDTVEDKIKISFWHDEPFVIPIGHISYRDPFYNFFYIPGPINKPEYIDEDEINPVDGVEFDLYLINKKEYRFVGVFPEYMCDMIRLIRHHHYRRIEFDGIVYEGFNLRIEFKEWAQNGSVRTVEFILTPDTRVTTTGKMIIDGEGFEYDQSEYDDSEFD